MIWDLQRHIVDFYISDYQSGLRALVKVGYGATVSPYVEESTILDISEKNRELPSNFMRWLAERNLSSDDRVMRLKEGYVTCFDRVNQSLRFLWVPFPRKESLVGRERRLFRILKPVIKKLKMCLVTLDDVLLSGILKRGAQSLSWV